MFLKKKGQISIEALIIVSVLIVGGIIFATVYLGQRNKLAQDQSRVLGTIDNIDYSGDFGTIVNPPTPPEPPNPNECSPYPEHCCNEILDYDEEGFNCGGADCRACTPIIGFGCESLGTPTFSPEGGVFNETVYLNLNYFDEFCPSAEIHYTYGADPADPTTSDPVFVPYSSPIEISSTQTIKAKIFSDNNGSIVSGNTVSQYYEINTSICDNIPGTVTFNPKGSTYNSQFKLELNYFDKICSSNYEILYIVSIDGVTPSVETVYSTPIELENKDTNITARVRVMNSSENFVYGLPKTERYTYNKYGCDGTIGQPTFTPSGGTYNQPIALKLTYDDASCSDYNIYYTTDNTEPTQSSLILGNRSIMISTDKNITAKVFAKKSDGTIKSGPSRKEEYKITAGGSSLCLSGVGGGTGTISNPKIICTPEELNDIRFGANLGKHYVLGQDIDLNHSILSNLDLSGGYNETYGWTPIGLQNNAFTGSLDGNGHKIKNLFINIPNCNSGLNGVGLFGHIGGSEPVIKNLEIIDANLFACVNYVGTLAGMLVSTNLDINNVVVSNVTIDSIGNYTGGLIGFQYYGNINNVSVTGNINSTGPVGGIIGANNLNSKLTNSSSNVDINGINFVGGLVGVVGGIIINSYSSGNISGNNNIGGITGSVTTGDINQSYFSGTVTGNSMVGGISGSMIDSANISKSYCPNTTIVNGQTKVGGIVGSLSAYSAYAVDLVEDSNFYGNVNGNSEVGGIVGYAYSQNAHTRYYKINKAHFNGNVTGNSNVGGIIGLCQLLLIKYLTSEGTITGNSNVGGIIGKGGLISEYSSFSGNINVIGDGNNIGGLVGYNTGSIVKSYSTGSINAPQGKNVGGAIGFCSTNDYIYDSYSRMNVSGDSNIGGFLGHKSIYSVCSLRRNYSTGLVSGNTNVGGFIGAPNIVNTGCQWNYWDMNTSGQTTTAQCNTSQYGYVVAGLTGRTTAQMNDWNSYGNNEYDGIPEYGGMGASWDFENVWQITPSKNNGYPYLRENYNN